MHRGGDSIEYVLRPADLVFVRGTSLIDRAIESVSHSPYNHVAGYIKDGKLEEAQGGRTTGYQFLEKYKKHADIYTCQMSDEQRQKIIQFVLSKIGTRYNYELIGWELLHYQFHMDLPMRDETCYDCSDLWREAYRAGGIILCPDLEHVSPGDLANDPHLVKVGEI